MSHLEDKNRCCFLCANLVAEPGCDKMAPMIELQDQCCPDFKAYTIDGPHNDPQFEGEYC